MEKTHLTEHELTEKFDAVLDMQTVSLWVMGQSLNIPGSRVVKLADETAYRTGLANYADYLERDFGITAEGYVS